MNSSTFVGRAALKQKLFAGKVETMTKTRLVRLARRLIRVVILSKNQATALDSLSTELCVLAPQSTVSLLLKQKKSSGTIAAGKEYERVASSWIEYQPKWKQRHSKKELNWSNNDKMCLCKNLWGVNMKVVLDHVTEVS